MLKKRIIPCLDVKDGRVVKGINFLDLVDAGDPVVQAKFYSENGADEICFLDIGASIENRNTMIKVVEKTAEKVFIPLTVGGGIKNIIPMKPIPVIEKEAKLKLKNCPSVPTKGEAKPLPPPNEKPVPRSSCPSSYRKTALIA